jgi:predicted phage terminase large subunit-like protein
LQWGGAIILVMTRWSIVDLTARLLDYAAKNPDADQWEVVEFPAILPSGKSLWPEKWSLEALTQTKASLDPKYWTAQYMQHPSSDEAAIISRQEWRIWLEERPPKCTYVIQCLDTASETNNRADFSSITTWGVFRNDKEREEYQIILLDRVNERLQFPELKAKTIEQFKRWEPDSFIVEKKGSGAPLYQELRHMGLPVQEYAPHRGSGDKVARLNAVADIVRSGKVWIPDTWWAREMIDQIAQFPNGTHDDDVDTTSMALTRFRQGGYLTLETDDVLSDKTQFYGRTAAYY